MSEEEFELVLNATTDGVDEAVDVLRNLSENVAVLDAGRMRMGLNEELCVALADVLKDDTKYSNLTSLDLSCNEMGDYGVSCSQIILEALHKNTTLLRLNLCANDLGVEGSACVADFIVSNKSVTELWLNDNDFGAEGCIALCNALESNTSITDLSLSLNHLQVEGAKAICDLLKKKSFIRRLELSSNGWGSHDDEVGLMFAQMLRQNSTLTELILSDNLFGGKSFGAIFESLALHNRTLLHLDLHSNKATCSEECAEKFRQMLVRNFVLKRLEISHNPLDDYFIGVALADGLKQNRTLTHLSISDLDLVSVEGMKSLMRNALRNQNTTLTHLDVSNNTGMRGALPLVVELFQENGTIKQLKGFFAASKYCERNGKMHARAKDAVIHLVAMRRFARWNMFPKEIVLMIGSHLWATRSHISAWCQWVIEKNERRWV